MTSSIDEASVARRWTQEERARATTGGDRQVVDEAGAARALLIARIANDDREALAAGYRLGAVYADLGATPSLAANVIAAAEVAFAERRPEKFTFAELAAAFIEGYVATTVEYDRARTLRAFRLRTCSVVVNKDTLAVVPPPTTEPDSAHATAAVLASEVVGEGYRQVFVGGEGIPREALVLALESVGVKVLTELRPTLLSLVTKPK